MTLKILTNLVTLVSLPSYLHLPTILIWSGWGLLPFIVYSLFLFLICLIFFFIQMKYCDSFLVLFKWTCCDSCCCWCCYDCCCCCCCCYVVVVATAVVTIVAAAVVTIIVAVVAAADAVVVVTAVVTIVVVAKTVFLRDQKLLTTIMEQWLSILSTIKKLEGQRFKSHNHVVMAVVGAAVVTLIVVDSFAAFVVVVAKTSFVHDVELVYQITNIMAMWSMWY